MDRERDVLGIPPAPTRIAPPTAYRAPGRLAKVVMALLAVNVVFDLGAALVDWQMLDFLERARQGDFVTFEEATEHDNRMAYAALLQFLALVACGIPFIVWFRRVYRNLVPLGTRTLRFGTGWAVGGWFVPFLGLVRPKSIANDVWRASDPDLPPEIEAPPTGVRVPVYMTLWWITFVVGAWIYPPLDFGGNAEPSLGELVFEVRRTFAGDVSSVVSGLLAVAVVRGITLRQEQRHARLASGALVREQPDQPADDQRDPV